VGSQRRCENVVAYLVELKPRIEVDAAVTAEKVVRAAQNMVVLCRGGCKPLVASVAKPSITFADNGRIAPVLTELSSSRELEAALVTRIPGNHDEILGIKD
jgi:hypothetical protein